MQKTSTKIYIGKTRRVKTLDRSTKKGYNKQNDGGREGALLGSNVALAKSTQNSWQMEIPTLLSTLEEKLPYYGKQEFSAKVFHTAFTHCVFYFLYHSTFPLAW